VFRKRRALANKTQTDIVTIQRIDLFFECIDEQVHDQADLLARTPPVFAAESKQGERLDTLVNARLDHPAHRLDALAVTNGARQHARTCPAAVTIHDDGDMAWTAVGLVLLGFQFIPALFRIRLGCCGYIAIRSASFSSITLSTSATR
jgi:hypothetical protein